LHQALARLTPERALMALIDVVLASGAGVLDEEYEMVWFPGDDLLAVCGGGSTMCATPTPGGCGGTCSRGCRSPRVRSDGVSSGDQ
jgi:hypothetical protein